MLKMNRMVHEQRLNIYALFIIKFCICNASFYVILNLISLIYVKADSTIHNDIIGYSDPFKAIHYRLGNFDLTFPKAKPTFSSQNKKFSFSIGTLIQYDVGGFVGSNHQKSVPNMAGTQAILRRGRLIFTARYNDFKLIIAPDFGRAALVNDSIHEANLNYTGFKRTVLSLGLLQPSITMYGTENSASFTLLERPMVTDLLRNIAGANARLAFAIKHWHKTYYISATISGQRLGETYQDFQKNQVGGIIRAVVHPVATNNYDLHLGFNVTLASHGDTRRYSMNSLPEAQIWSGRPYIRTGKVDGVNNVWAIGPEFALRLNRLILQGEYYSIYFQRVSEHKMNRPDLQFAGWYISTNYILLGQARHYSSEGAFFAAPQGILFNPAEKDWGALECSIRWSEMDLNSHRHEYDSVNRLQGVQGGRQIIIATGLNWYPLMNMRLSLNYNYVKATKSRNNFYNKNGRIGNLILSRIQFNF